MTESAAAAATGKAGPSLYSRIAKWVIRLLTAVIVILVALIAMVSLLSGTGDMQRKGLEQALSEMLSVRAEIGELKELTMFPDISVDIGNIRFYAARSAAQIGEMQAMTVTFGFWDILFGRGVIRHFEMEGLGLEAGPAGPHVLYVNRAAIDAEQRAFHFSGRYGSARLDGEIGLEKTPDGAFSLAEISPFGLRLAADSGAEAEFSGSLGLEGETIRLRDIALKSGPETLAAGSLSYGRGGAAGSALEGDLTLGDSRLVPALTVAGDLIAGRLRFPVLDLGDVAGQDAALPRLMALYRDLWEQPGPSSGPEDDAPLDLSGPELDLGLEITSLERGGAKIGRIQAVISRKDGMLTIAPVSGTVADGSLSGDISLKADAQTDAGALAAKAILSGFDYGILQTLTLGSDPVTAGRADFALEIESTGKDAAGLVRGLNGKATLIAGRGEMRSGALNFWGGGLVNAILPKLDPESETVLNCAIADFRIEQGISRVRTLFLDTARVTLTGEGEIDLGAQKIDLTLDPKAKDMAIGDVATAVNVSGDLFDPAIRPDAASAALKIGGLLLGAVNPAFLAYSLTDLGLGDDHPCRDFIKPE